MLTLFFSIIICKALDANKQTLEGYFISLGF